MGERSRSPMPGAESEAKDAVATTQQDTNLFVQSQISDIHRLLSQHTGKLNTLDQRSAQTKDQLQKQQQLEASKQAIISSWPDSATQRDREQAIEKLVETEGLRRMHTCTQTLKSKGGLAHFSIVEFYTKQARNELLDMVKKDMLICHGQIQVGRAQILKYQREADQPFRCAIAVYAQIAGRQQRYKLSGSLRQFGMEGNGFSLRNQQSTTKHRSQSTSARRTKKPSLQALGMHGPSGASNMEYLANRMPTEPKTTLQSPSRASPRRKPPSMTRSTTHSQNANRAQPAPHIRSGRTKPWSQNLGQLLHDLTVV